VVSDLLALRHIRRNTKVCEGLYVYVCVCVYVSVREIVRVCVRL
jgi:hypothetical protein